MYEVTISEEDLYTKVIVKGYRTPSQKTDAATAWIEIADHCTANKTKKLLVISKLTGSISQLSSYDVSRSLEHFGLKKDIKIAFVEIQKQPFEVNSFSSRFTKNNGYEIKVTMSEDDAVAWLIQ